MVINFGACKRIEPILFSFLIVVCVASTGVCDEDALTEYELRMMIPNTVSLSGAVTYTVPITVPAGRLGLQPELALTYNSYIRNGWIGRGWQINVGAIQRSTKYGVDYNAFEFVADGKELLPVDIDDNGNGIYRTKIESDFKHFTFDRSTGWVVTLRDGRQLFYGQNEPSRQDDPADPSRIFKWCLDKVVDTNFNFMTVSYEKDQGQIYLKQIDYTGNTGQAGGSDLEPQNSVVFHLEEMRNDVYETFVPIFGVTTAKRLISIEVRNQDQVVRAYQLNYHDTSGAIMSMLSNIRFFGADVSIDDGVITSGQDQMLKQIELDCPHGKLGGLYLENHATVHLINEPSSGVISGDYDGDGKVDLLVRKIRYPATPVYFSRENGTFEVKNEPTGSAINHRDTIVCPGDFDGDGKTDILLKNKRFSTTTVLLSNGAIGTFEKKESVLPLINHVNTQIYPGDYNGDGKADILLKSENFASTPVFLSNGDGTFEPKNFPTPLWINANITRIYRGDFNGDGKTDILSSNQNFITTPVLFSNGDGSFTETNIGTDNWINEFTTTLIPGDYNGDGKTDILLKNNNYHSTPVYFSRGDGTFEVTNEPTTPSWVNPNETILYPGDYNGDGCTDILLKKEGFYTTPILFSNGDGTFDPTNEDTPDWVNLDDSRLHQGDFNGDGKTDIVLTHRNFLTAPVLLSEAEPGLLTSAKSSYGSTHTFEYASSSQYSNAYLPFIVRPVSKISTDDGNGVLSDVNFDYSGGFFDPTEREFRGFEKITKIFSNGTMERTEYYQGYNPNYFLKGKPKYKELCFHAGSPGLIVLEKVDYIWGQRYESPDRAFAFLDEKISKSYENGDLYLETTKDYVSYDAVGNLEQVVEADAAGSAEDVTQTFEYHNYGTVTHPMYRKTMESIQGQESGLVRQTNYAYTSDGRANLENKTLYNDQGEDSVYHTEYDGYGNLLKSWEPGRSLQESPTIEYTYENLTQTFPETTTNCAGHTTTVTWNYLFGKVATEIDPNNNETRYSYDQFGRLDITEYPNGGIEDRDYGDQDSPRWELIKVRESTDPLSTVNTWEYFDGLNRSIQTVAMGVDENGDIRPVVTRTYYDKMGRQDRVVGPFFATDAGFQAPPEAGVPVSWTEYDRRDRPVIEAYLDSRIGSITTEYRYDGLRTTIIDPDKSQKTTVKDYMGRIGMVVDYTESDEQYTYYSHNAADDLTSVKDALDNQTIIIHDTLGRKIYQKDPDMGGWSYQYHANGELGWQKDAIGKEIEYAYDCLNRVKSKTVLNPGPQDHNVLYTYDDNQITAANAIGRLSKVDNGLVTTFYRDYDAMGNLLTQGKVIIGAPDELKTTYGFDLTGKVTATIFPRGREISLVYHPGTGLLRSIAPPGDDAPLYAYFGAYTASGELQKTIYSNQVVTEKTYDPESRRLIRNLTTRNIDGAADTLIDKTYTYYPSGDIETIDDRVAVNTRFYQYDKLHRLISETGSSDDYAYLMPSTMEYGYDPDTDYQDPSATPAHGVGTIDVLGSANRFVYDANGNMTSGPDLTDPASPAQRHLTYNADNMPVQITHSTHGTTTLTYDGQGERAKKKSGSNVTYYYGTHYEWVNGEDINYVFADNQRIAMLTHAGNYYFHKDHLGSSTIITDQNGQVYQQTGYLPYGMQRGSADITLTSYKFTDQEQDRGTGLYNYDARLYDPVIGTFITADSIEPDTLNAQSLNRYSYCLNSPLVYVDPSGHFVLGHPNDDFGYLGRDIESNRSPNPYKHKRSEDLQKSYFTYEDAPAEQFFGYGWDNDLLGLRPKFRSLDPELVLGEIPFVRVLAVGAAKGLFSLAKTIFRNAPKRGRSVIGKQKVIENPKNLLPGEKKLPVKVGKTTKETWKSNRSELRNTIRKRQPIRDVTPDIKTQFLEAERSLLKNRGWTFDGTYWNPPK